VRTLSEVPVTSSQKATGPVADSRSVIQSTYCLVTWSNGLTAVRTLSEVPVTSSQKATGSITAGTYRMPPAGLPQL